MSPDDDFFTPEDVDEQIDSLAQAYGHLPTAVQPAERLVTHLQDYYRSAEKQHDPLDSAWKRIVAARQAKPQTTERKGRLIFMPNTYSGSDRPASHKKRTLWQRVGVLAAILFVGLLVGGMVLMLNINHHTPQSARNQAQAVTGSGGTPMPTPAHPLKGGKCSLDTTNPAPQKSATSVPGAYVFGMYDQSDNVLYRYDPQTKKVVWHRQLCNAFNFVGTVEQNGILYLAGVDYTHESGSGSVAYLYALNETDGSAIWGVQFPTKIIPFKKGDPNYGSSPLDLGAIEPPTIDNGVVYVVQRTGVVYAFNARNGGQLWSFNSGRNVWATSASGQGGGSILDASSVQIVNGVAYFSIVDRLFALNPHTGQQLWTYSFDNAQDINQGLAIDDGPIYLTAFVPGYGQIADPDTYVYAFDAQSGSKTWVSAKMTGYLNAPVAGDGHLLVTSYSGTWYTLNPASGALESQKSVAGGGFGTPLLINGVLYNLTESETNNVLATLNFDGSTRWSVQVSSKYPVIEDIKNGVIYISGRGSGLYAYSASDGKLLWHYGGYHMQPDGLSPTTVVP
jgi:outer membrane protein assembly factor BamB